MTCRRRVGDPAIRADHELLRRIVYALAILYKWLYTWAMKPLKWIGASKNRLCAFPEVARRKAGYQFGQVQLGEQPDDFKPMPAVGAGVMEIRIHEPHEHRVFYVAKFEEAVYVLHAFEKKTQQTAEKELKVARAAYAEMEKQRKKAKT